MSRLFRRSGRASWPARLVRSRHARAVGLALAAGEGMGAAIAVVVIIANLVRRAPVPALAPLLVLAIPLVFAGQLLMIGSARNRSATNRVPLRTALNPWATWQRLTGNTNRRLGVVLVALAVAGWVTAISAVPAFERGSPAPPTPGCRYQLAEHGSAVCVSPAEYQQAGAAEQRFLTGILLSFLALHTGAALGTLARTENTGDAPAG